MVDQGVRQLSGSVGPGANGQPLTQGGRYAFQPITEANVHQHIAMNPAANERNVLPDQEPEEAVADPNPVQLW